MVRGRVGLGWDGMGWDGTGWDGAAGTVPTPVVPLVSWERLALLVAFAFLGEREFILGGRRVALKVAHVVFT